MIHYTENPNSLTQRSLQEQLRDTSLVLKAKYLGGSAFCNFHMLGVSEQALGGISLVANFGSIYIVNLSCHCNHNYVQCDLYNLIHMYNIIPKVVHFILDSVNSCQVSEEMSVRFHSLFC